jgi:phosphate transport system permease protein
MGDAMPIRVGFHVVLAITFAVLLILKFTIVRFYRKTIIMAVAAVPFGVITAIYLAEYASEKSVIAKTIRFAVKTLAVVPSIIFGLFGLGFFIGFIGKNMDGMDSGPQKT